MDNNQTPSSERLDQATADRLRRLLTMPLDLTRLEASLKTAIRRPGHAAGRPLVMRLLRPATAVAASIGVLLLIGVLVLGPGGREVMASPAQMAQVHRDIVAGRVTVHRVDSIDAAGRTLAEMYPGKSPELPDAPEAHVMACCMKDVADKKVACVLLSSEGTPITMSVARAKDMRSPQGTVVDRGGAKFYVVGYETLSMVSTEREGRWVCLIGEVSPERLIQIARTLKF